MNKKLKWTLIISGVVFARMGLYFFLGSSVISMGETDDDNKIRLSKVG
jgi:hypothetical protein